MTITIQIPVPVYLFKYLLIEMGHNLQIEKKDSLSRILLAELEGRDKQYKKLRLKEGQVYFNVCVSERYFYRNNKCMVTTESASNFLSYAEKEFKRSLRTFVNGRISVKADLRLKDKRNMLSMVKAIQDFLAQYDITEEDYKFETATKYFKRYLARKNEGGTPLHPACSVDSLNMKSNFAPNVLL